MLGKNSNDIYLVLGPVVSVSALAASLADFTILGQEHGQLFMSSPLETPECISGEVDASGLGGATFMQAGQALHADSR